jgi:hypothetical protein
MTGPVVKLTYTVQEDRLKALGTAPNGSIRVWMLRTILRVDSLAKRKLSGQVLHVRTGNLRSSQGPPTIEIRGGKLVAVEVNTASYARALHDGSRPHEIRPRRRAWLTGWSYGGAPVFTKVVHHPGTRAKPWLRDSLTEVMHTL